MIAFLLALTPMLAQNFEQRGFIENRCGVYPQTAPDDSSHAIDETLFRWEASYKVAPWLEIARRFRCGDRYASTRWSANSGSIGTTVRFSGLRFHSRRFSATLHKGQVTAELGRQFIRWGKADILNPTDRFAPKDYLEQRG